ncbi:MAG: GNAT family N-acetyltransferase [Sedimentisphaerales bacterium]|nr:GNAT family N-acetyltransferase [Sedimentisphaerales bacterium]
MANAWVITKVEPGQKQQADDLVAMAFASLRQYYVPCGECGELPSKPRCLIIKKRGEVVGTLSYYFDSPYVRLYRIAVRIDCRRQGVARSLIEYVDKYVAGPRGDELALYAVKETGNVEIFEKLGFAVQSESVAQFAKSPTGGEVYEVEMVRRRG